jgi:DNA-binding GntR family transcriptional regulator
MTYREIADDVAARIAAGEFPTRSRLPTTVEFAERYDVSEATAYRALSLLVDRGVIHGEAGRGRFVN